MSTTVQTAFRLEARLIERLDKRAEQMRRRTGTNVTRADVVRILLTQGLRRKKGKR